MEAKQEINNFSEYYNNLGLLPRREFRKEICSGLSIEYPMFMRKLRNDNWSQVERAAIQQIINRNNHEEGY